MHCIRRQVGQLARQGAVGGSGHADIALMLERGAPSLCHLHGCLQTIPTIAHM